MWRNKKTHCKYCGCKLPLNSRFQSCHSCFLARMRGKSKHYYSLHKEQFKIKDKEYYLSHKEEINKRARCWQTNNTQKVNESVKRWRIKNPEKAKLQSAKRDFKERNAEGNFTLVEWNNKLKEYNYRCAYCGCELSSGTITIDHVIPISKGGTNYISNLVPACVRCNCRKHTKTVEEFMSILLGEKITGEL